ncbi:MAG TPA: hypothetical protein VIS96_11795 [Terrimicrobiaceae bacterium]
MPEEPPYEKGDVHFRGVLIFALALAVGVVLTLFLVGGMIALLAQHPPSAIRASPTGTPAVVPPPPALQAQPWEDLRRYRDEQNRILLNYAWIDRKTGVVRIPIERAMELVIERGPTPSGGERTPLEMRQQKALEKAQ